MRIRLKKPKIFDPLKHQKFIVGSYVNKSIRYVLNTDPSYILWFKNHVPKCYWPRGFSAAIEVALDLVDAKRKADKAAIEAFNLEQAFLRSMRDFQSSTGIDPW